MDSNERISFITRAKKKRKDSPEGVTFSQVANSIIDNLALSINARFLLIWIFRQADNYKFYVQKYCELNRVDKNTVGKVIKELVQAGYCHKVTINKRLVEYFWYELPELNPYYKLSSENPPTLNSKTGTQQVVVKEEFHHSVVKIHPLSSENPPTLNTGNTNYNTSLYSIVIDNSIVKEGDSSKNNISLNSKVKEAASLDCPVKEGFSSSVEEPYLGFDIEDYLPAKSKSVTKPLKEENNSSGEPAKEEKKKAIQLERNPFTGEAVQEKKNNSLPALNKAAGEHQTVKEEESYHEEEKVPLNKDKEAVQLKNILEGVTHKESIESIAEHNRKLDAKLDAMNEELKKYYKRPFKE